MPDIHFSMAKNSELIFTRNGRHLCSGVHPTREARQWVLHHSPQWKSCESIIVLGLGCGYHVRALKASSVAAVFVLEPDQEIIKAAMKVHPLDLQESHIFMLKSATSPQTEAAIVEATRSSYCVLVHEPSAFKNPALFEQTKRFLLGREKEGLLWLFKNRGFELPPDFQVTEGSEISLKTLDSLWSRQIEGRADLMPLMQALRELIL